MIFTFINCSALLKSHHKPFTCLINQEKPIINENKYKKCIHDLNEKFTDKET